MAFGHSLNRVSGTLKNGNRTDLWLRWTACFRKIDGGWLVTHDPALLGGPRIPEGEQSTPTLTASEGVAVAGTLTDAVIVPLQCEGWARYSESPDDIRKAFADAEFADRVRWLEPGRRSEMCNER